MKNLKALLIGGNGKTGKKVAQRLKESNIETKVVSRSTPIKFDWYNSNTWENAFLDVSAIYITFQPDLAVPGSQQIIRSFVKLALEKGIKRMVLLSGRGESEAQACEKILINSGADYTIVRCDWFSQNFTEGMFLEPIKAGQVALPKSATKIAFVDTDDIADVVVKSLLNDDHIGQVYELTGPRLVTFREVTLEIAHATNRNIEFIDIDIPQYTSVMKDHQVPDDYIWLVDYLFTEVLDGRNESTTDTIEKVLGRKAKDISEYIQETANSGVWSAA